MQKFQSGQYITYYVFTLLDRVVSVFTKSSAILSWILTGINYIIRENPRVVQACTSSGKSWVVIWIILVFRLFVNTCIDMMKDKYSIITSTIINRCHVCTIYLGLRWNRDPLCCRTGPSTFQGHSDYTHQVLGPGLQHIGPRLSSYRCLWQTAPIMRKSIRWIAWVEIGSNWLIT